MKDYLLELQINNRTVRIIATSSNRIYYYILKSSIPINEYSNLLHEKYYDNHFVMKREEFMEHIVDKQIIYNELRLRHRSRHVPKNDYPKIKNLTITESKINRTEYYKKVLQEIFSVSVLVQDVYNIIESYLIKNHY